MIPINLKELYGRRYHITLDESALHEKKGKDDPWYFQIECHRGHIYPYSDKLLAYYCTGPKIRTRLSTEHPEYECIQWSDDYEAVFLFPVEEIKTVCKYAKPKKRRDITTDQQKKMSKHGHKTRFKPKTNGLQSS